MRLATTILVACVAAIAVGTARAQDGKLTCAANAVKAIRPNGAIYCRSTADDGRLLGDLLDGTIGSIVRPCPFDVTFVIDESGSIDVAGFAAIKGFMKAVMDTFDDFSETGSHFGTVAFASNTVERFKLGAFGNLADYKTAIDAIPRSKGSEAGDITGTCINCGIKRAIVSQAVHDATEGAAHAIDRKKVMFVVTDGKTTSPHPSPEPAANAARAAGFYVFAIGVSRVPSIDELRQIANNPDIDYLWQVLDFDQLETLGGLLGVGLDCGGVFDGPNNE